MSDETATGPKPCLILGLGNPGERYRKSRHNCGFRVAEALAERWQMGLAGEQCGSRVYRIDQVLVAAPQTFMNRSGHAARCFAELEGLGPEQILVVYDDVYLDLGRLRLRPRGGPGGHRGMESIVESLQSDRVARLRMGIRPPGSELDGERLVDFVLEDFEADESGTVEEMVQRAAQACECWLQEGIEEAMNRFNAAPVNASEGTTDVKMPGG